MNKHIRFTVRNMPRFNASCFDHRLDNQVIPKSDLRFHEQDTAEEFATAQFEADFIPRSVIRGATGLHMVLENPEHVEHPSEVFYINSSACEG